VRDITGRFLKKKQNRKGKTMDSLFEGWNELTMEQKAKRIMDRSAYLIKTQDDLNNMKGELSAAAVRYQTDLEAQDRGGNDSQP
jgi:succinate dehydrogenase/fumarate reductase flavoprotein subunit